MAKNEEFKPTFVILLEADKFEEFVALLEKELPDDSKLRALLNEPGGLQHVARFEVTDDA